MEYFRLMLRGLNVDKRAVTAIEYALIASLVAVALVGSLNSLKGGISGAFASVIAAF
jgi:pilus assembly protein Flp/PilA